MRLTLIFLSLALSLSAQPGTFSSGSTGADGPLTYDGNLGVIYFPPAGLGMRPNNVYNFTTITIGKGTTVRLSGWVLNGPVYWLATGDVNIDGTIDLTGQAGYLSATGNPSTRAPSEPGAGGYAGGVGALGVGQLATAGNGPGGGSASGGDGSFSGSNYLIPLLGGSGGGGGTGANAGGGGAGGGAILIASSTQIVMAEGGTINASGAGGGDLAGAGSGGAIRLVSNVVTNSVGGGCQGSFYVRPPGGGAPSGLVRFEGYTVNVVGAAGGCGVLGNSVTSTPHNVAIPTGGISMISVTSINGMPINANPFNFPDATIATGSTVSVVISGTNIPPNTSGTLYIFSENAADQTFPFTLTATGAPNQTSATISVSYPVGGSRGFARAVWVSP
jgi:hypothetical protein